jgi:hypothetical protein
MKLACLGKRAELAKKIERVTASVVRKNECI